LPQGSAFTTWAALFIFAAGFTSFVLLDKHRHLLAVIAAGLVVALGLEGPLEALAFVNWKIIIIFFATLVAAEIFMLSGAAAVTAEAIIAKFRNPAWAVLVLCALTGFLSAFVENVACVLIAAPVALSLAKRLKMPPQPVLIGCALASNLQGCALLVGDPPSMLLAAEAKFTFADFIWYAGRPSIFWSVQVGAVAGLAVLWFAFRKYRGEVHLKPTSVMIGRFPTVCLVGVVASLAVDTQIEGGIGWGAAIGTSIFAVLSFAWYWLTIGRKGGVDESAEEALLDHKLPSTRGLVFGLDWRTTLFLIAIFVPISALDKYGWVSRLGTLIATIAGGNRLIAFSILVTTAVAASAVVDNVPFLLVMLPTVTSLAKGLGIDWNPVFLYFGLLLGASVGGNITPVGAQANITAVGFLRKHGAPVTLKEYLSLSLPYTIAAVAVACFFTYLTFGIVPPGP
jgi:Na+/H+ antiporter NhaD/arsenite permease-like protein